MNVLPKVKEFRPSNGELNVNGINWMFIDIVDERIKKAAYKIVPSNENGIPFTIKHGNENSERYKVVIADKVEIISEGPAGAYYALQTLSILMEENNGIIKCGEIVDFPDMEFRGFYYDVTRGRIPKLDKLKELVDNLSKFKINSLQLYIEHTFEFEEYKFCRDSLGYISKEEIKALDEYCKEHFIELIPSIATFGHLYHLMESKKYKHLCELKDYIPTEHYYIERLKHHTINPLKEESFTVITSLIDQCLEVFSSDKFNICCDETVDLCRDVNSDKKEQKGRIYVDFVKKIVNYLKSTGKINTIMMWGDIAIRHLDCIDEIPKEVVLIDWDYNAVPNENNGNAYRLLNRKLLVAPGTYSWNDFSENINVSEKNIKAMADRGYKANAWGILNTDWGDYGHLHNVDTSYHGIIFGAAVAWDKETVSDDKFKKMASKIVYGNDDTINILYELCKTKHNYSWGRLIRPGYDSGPLKKSENEHQEMMKICEKLHDTTSKLYFKNNNLRDNVLITIDGHALFLKWLAVKYDYTCNCYVDFNEWLNKYVDKWMEENKITELNELIRLFKVLDGRNSSNDYIKPTEIDEVVKLYPDLNE